MGSQVYAVSGTDTNSCVNIDSLNIIVEPILNSNQSLIICQSELPYAWNGALFNESGTQTVVLTSILSGCDSLATMNLNVINTLSTTVDTTICQDELPFTWNGLIVNSSGLKTLNFTSLATGCDSIISLNVLVNALPTVNAGANQIFCEGTTTTVNGSGAPSYIWDNGVSDGVGFIPPVGTGTYTVIGTDGNGCQNTDELSILVNPLPTVNAGVDQSFCVGTSTILSGSGAIIYEWDQSIDDGTPFSPPSGIETYTVTGTDSNGCSNSDTVVLTVHELPDVFAGSDQELCDYGDLLTLSATGAETYEWTNNITDGLGFFPSLGTTTYSVTGTDANGCENTDDVSVLVNPLPALEAGQDQTFCEGTTTVVNGSGATSYAWDNGVNNGIDFVPPVGTNIYSVVGTDVNGCQNTDELTILVNALPPVNSGGDQSICFGEAITLQALTAQELTVIDFEVEEEGYETPLSVFGSNFTDVFNRTDIDLPNCTNEDGFYWAVEDLQVVNPQLNLNSIDVSGLNYFLFSIDLLAHHYNDWDASDEFLITYSLDGGEYQNLMWVQSSDDGSSFNEPAALDIDFNGEGDCGNGTTLPSLTTGTGNSGCVVSSSNFETFTSGVINLSGNSTLNIKLQFNGFTSTDEGLYFDNITISSGEIENVSYEWSSGINDGISFIPPSGIEIYTVTGTDSNGCSNSDEVVLTVYELPNVFAGSNQEVCNNGDLITVSASGAETYQWTNGITDGVGFLPNLGTTTYSVTGTDVNGCVNTDELSILVNPLPIVEAGPNQTFCEGNATALSASGATTYFWDNGVNDGIAFIPIVGSTTYTVVGTDVNGCQNTDELTILVNPLPNVFAGSDLTLCEGEPALLSGSGAMHYDWSGGVVDGNSFVPNTGTNLYQVVGTDNNGCSNSDEISVVVNPLPIVSAGPNQSLCIGNTIVLVGSGASSYEWNNGVTDLIPFQPGVGSQNYTLIGTDGNGCQNTDQVNVTVFALPNVNAGIDQELCEGASTALQAVGAVSYAWDNNAVNGASFVPNIGTSQYTVTGTDINGCVNTDEMLITVYALPDVFAGVNQQLCNGESTFVNATGAVNYQWNNGVTNGVQFTPPQGTMVYTVEGTDANGCSNTDQLSIEVNAIPIIDAGSNQSICDGNSVILFASGTGTLIWSQGVSNGVPFVPPLGFNTYNVSVVDVNGCFNTDEVSVSVNPIPAVYAGVDIEICEEEPVTLNASGAQSYAWSGGVVNNIAFVPSVGNYVYTVTGTTDEGCSASDQVEVLVNSFTYGVDSHTACDAFVWMDGIEYTQSNNSATYILTNSNGCDSIVTLNLTMSYQSDTTLFVSSLGDYSLNGQVYSESGTYVQQIENQYGCDSTIYLQLNITQSGIDELASLGIRAYPNPFSSILHLDFEQLMHEQRLVLTDINGKVLLQRYNLQLNNVIQLNDLESGMYYLNLFQKDRPIGQLKVMRY